MTASQTSFEDEFQLSFNMSMVVVKTHQRKICSLSLSLSSKVVVFFAHRVNLARDVESIAHL